jgi:hypothetical protein
MKMWVRETASYVWPDKWYNRDSCPVVHWED